MVYVELMETWSYAKHVEEIVEEESQSKFVLNEVVMSGDLITEVFVWVVEEVFYY